MTDVLPKYRDISMVFQSYALYPHKTVAENIGFPLKVRKVDKAEMDAAIREAAAQVQLEQLLDRYPRQLSGRPAPARCAGARHHPPARPCSSWTSRCPISMPSSAATCGPS